MPNIHSLRRRILSLCAGGVLLLAGAAWAGPPAAIPDADQQRASRAFDRFAGDWMGKMKRVERDNRAKPKRAGAGMSYRGYASDFKTELKPTGHPSAPYVGILRYREHRYQCDAKGSSCRVVASTPVTEIFRFQNGRWIY